uniref:Aspartyl/asparaginy/proline hydroxylase domain-containing protein n=1 Tax=Equus asinus asinus TaxID=83772 RepID=A0A8C4MAX9_EQUAS
MCSTLPSTAHLTQKCWKLLTFQNPGFSVHLRTHVWPHTGPTNCRLRMHLGLVIPKEGCKIRCANETKTWEEGKVLIFDDSFEHEVWQDAASFRLIFIVDVWHPELTPHQRRSLPAI